MLSLAFGRDLLRELPAGTNQKDLRRNGNQERENSGGNPAVYLKRMGHRRVWGLT